MADTFQVTGQAETQTLTPAGTIQDVMRITFATKPSGVIATVDVPLDTYSPDTVAAAITPLAASIETVQAL